MKSNNVFISNYCLIMTYCQPEWLVKNTMKWLLLIQCEISIVYWNET